MLARGNRGFAFAGTGPNMSGPGTLVEYLVRCLNTICGRWARAGDRVRVPGTLLAPQPAKAQPIGPSPAYGLTDPLPGTDQRGSVAGLPTAALPAAILHDGDTRIRALISISGNPAAAVPDQLKVVEALEALDLLVQVDITMSTTAQLADYVVAPTMSLEVPSCTALQDQLSRTFVGIGYGDPWAQYTKAVAERPSGADLLEEWEFLYGLARRMDLDLAFGMPGSAVPPVPLDMHHAPTTDELLDLMTAGSRVPLDEVRKHPHGALFPEPRVEVEAKDPDCTDRLDVANPDMMRDLAEVATRSARTTDAVLPSGERLEFRLVSRRIQQAINSSGRSLRGLRKRRYNPAFIHPDDLDRLGLAAGDVAEIRSARAAIIAIVQPDATLRRGLVSMTHAFGGLPGRDDVPRNGSNTGRLLTVDADIQPYTGQPLMSNVPVAVRALGPQDHEPDL
jgi:anaerobic selenocysteine-containing dehydrogenase